MATFCPYDGIVSNRELSLSRLHEHLTQANLVGIEYLVFINMSLIRSVFNPIKYAPRNGT